MRLKVIAYDANFGNAPDYVIDQFQQTITLPIGTNNNVHFFLESAVLAQHLS